MSDVILFGLPPSTYTRTAMLVLENKGVPYRLDPVDFRSEAYGARHPFHRVPAFEHGGVRLYETLAIATYVDEAFDGPALQPSDAAAKAEMLQWISVINAYAYPVIVGQCVAERFVKPMRGLKPDEAVIAAAKGEIARQLDIFDTALSMRSFLSGEAAGLADFFLGPILVYLAATPEGEELLPARIHLEDWQKRIAQSRGYTRINALE